jgi:Methyltransferase domain
MAPKLEDSTMQSATEQIENLDTELFKAISSQTTEEERQSLLAVQRAVAKKLGNYTYLEIGSHLGGSIQPYLVDNRCKTIYSIDARPLQLPDDRGVTVEYPDNSTARMLELLGKIDPLQVRKITCFDTDASDILADQIATAPQVSFIDGQHTKSSVLSDFQFCHMVTTPDGTIVFHDFQVIYPAIYEICRLLKKQRRRFAALKLAGSVFAVFFDPSLVQSDPYLAEAYARNKHFLNYWRLHVVWKRVYVWIAGILPAPIRKTLKYCWKLVTK